MAKEMTPQEAETRITDLCATAEYSTGEAMQRLHLWGISKPESIAIVQRLVDSRFIDDMRFARAFVRTKINISRWGRIKTAQSLAQKGVDRAIIAQAIEEETDLEQYYANLAHLLRAKAASYSSPLTHDQFMKTARYAQGRGYETDLIFDMLRDEDYWRNEPVD